MDQLVPTVLQFDRFALDLTRGTLRVDGVDLALRPKSFEVLRHLAENAGRLVPKRELIGAVWPNVFVSDDSLVQCIRELREKLGDSEHRLIKTVSRRGYLLDAPALAVAASFADVPLQRAARENEGVPAGADAPAPLPPIAVPQRAQSFRRGHAGLLAATLLLGGAAAGYVVWPPATPHAMQPVAAAGHVTAHQAFRDCQHCPEMVSLPSGTFLMGSPADEPNRVQIEGLPRRVVISRPFAIGRFEVTVEQYAAFVAETRTPVSKDCRIIEPPARAQNALLDEGAPPPRPRLENNAVAWERAVASFREQPGYTVSGMHPAGCISRIEAEAFVAWLRSRTGKLYRLPTETEWEYAARAGTTTRYSFGNDETRLCAYARFSDLASAFTWRGACRGAVTIAGALPVGSLKPNPWGLFDMHGNVWEWVADCWTPDPDQIPGDGSAARTAGGCELGVIRGGSWAANYTRVRSAFRLGTVAVRRDQNIGFRVALSL